MIAAEADEIMKALDAAHERILELHMSGRYIPESDVKSTLRQISRAMLKLNGYVTPVTTTSQQSASPSPPQVHQESARTSAPPIPTSPDTNNQEK